MARYAQGTTSYPLLTARGLKTAPVPSRGERENRMAITDELRHNIEGAEQLYGRECPRLRAMCDRIDEEHRKAMDDSYRDGYQEGKRDGDDEWYEEHESYLEEHGWYQALDADKEVIHADDELFWKVDGTPAGRVTAIGVGQLAGYVWTLLDGHAVWIAHNADKLYHKQPTVEDVLREMLNKWGEMPANMTNEAIVAEYAKKLALAGSDAE